MRLGRVRRWSRVVAVILLIAAGRGLPHFAQDDPGCTPGPFQLLLAEGGSDHVGGGPARARTPEHCALCHWSRSLRSPLASLPAWVTQAHPPTLVSRRPAPSAFTVVLPALPARAPPASVV